MQLNRTESYSLYPVTPSDTVDVPNYGQTSNKSVDGVFVLVSGNVQLTLDTAATGTSIILLAVPANSVIPVRVTRIWAASTTATGVYAAVQRTT